MICMTSYMILVGLPGKVNPGLSNREKNSARAIKRRKNDQKTTILIDKNDVRNDKKRRRNDHFLHLKDD